MSESMSESKPEITDPNQTFRILIASDCHLGYNERHPERGDDSFRAFEEVLHLAKEEDVDLILLGGDLFHLNKPSFQTVNKTIDLLREYCFGSRPIQFRIVSDQSENFSHYKNFKYANYLDENLNISMPVFTIHGNHDDPTGPNHITALDSLSSAGLINYFGKYTNIDEILLSPILLQKGECKIALYGLGSVNEERLYRIVTDGKLNYCMPETNEEEWFKVVVVHQNRVKHANTKYLPERFLSELPQLVVWGHEHESRPEPDWNETEQFYVYQPGSTVATSLCEAEALPKHCGILEVSLDETFRKPNFTIKSRRLKTVRNFVWDSIDISDLIGRKQVRPEEESIKEYCRERVEAMIQKARLDHSGDAKQPMKPLIRLRLEYSDESQQFHSAQFGAHFSGRVANHSDIISYVKRRDNRSYEEEGNIDLNEMRNLLDQEVIGERVNVTDIIKNYFEKLEDKKHKLGILSENALSLAVIELVEKDSNEAISDVFEAQKFRIKESLMALEDLKIEDIKEEISKLKEQTIDVNNSQDLAKILAESRNRYRTSVKTEPNNGENMDFDGDSVDIISDHSVDETTEWSLPPQTAKRGGSRGRGRARGRGRPPKRSPVESKPRLSSTQTFLDEDSEPSTSSTRRSPRRGVTAKKPKYTEYTISSDSD